MVIERSEAIQGYPPLPTLGAPENDPPRQPSPDRSSTRAPMAELSRQLQELIPELQGLTLEIRALRAERRPAPSSEATRAMAVTEPAVAGKDVARRAISSDSAINRRLRRRRSSSLKAVFLVFLVAGFAASILAGLVLFFHGPDIV